MKVPLRLSFKYKGIIAKLNIEKELLKMSNTYVNAVTILPKDADVYLPRKALFA